MDEVDVFNKNVSEDLIREFADKVHMEDLENALNRLKAEFLKKTDEIDNLSDQIYYLNDNIISLKAELAKKKFKK